MRGGAGSACRAEPSPGSHTARSDPRQEWQSLLRGAGTHCRSSEQPRHLLRSWFVSQRRNRNVAGSACRQDRLDRTGHRFTFQMRLPETDGWSQTAQLSVVTGGGKRKELHESGAFTNGKMRRSQSLSSDLLSLWLSPRPVVAQCSCKIVGVLLTISGKSPNDRNLGFLPTSSRCTDFFVNRHIVPAGIPASVS